MEKIRDDMRGVKVSVIIDESPDITGVPTINTLLCYYSQKNVKKHVVLVDVDRVNASNSYTVASAVSKALLTVGKTWKDVVAVATDSAKYMRKMVREICQAEGIQILHVKDIAHLIHKRLLGQSFEDYRPLLMSVTDNVDSLNEEFNQYLLEASPTNPAVELIEYCVAGFWLVNLAKVLPPNSAMDKKTYKRTMSTLQARIQRLEENLENSRIEGAQKNAMLKELLELCAEKDDQLRRDAEEVNEIRREFEELKRLHARSQRGCVSCVIM
ncbi:hypothetical protein MRX96_010163 [Rhipicephalus microplus]